MTKNMHLGLYPFHISVYRCQILGGSKYPLYTTKSVEDFFSRAFRISRVLKTFQKRQKWIPGTFLIKSYTSIFFSTRFLHHKKRFLKIGKIFFRKFSDSGKGLGILLYNYIAIIFLNGCWRRFFSGNQSYPHPTGVTSS